MSPRTRGESFDRKRQQIAEAAAEVFAEKGFTGATNREIAAAAGISPGLIYWYFENKEDLFASIFERLVPYRAVQVPEDVADGLPVEEFLHRIARAFLETMSQPRNQRMFRLVLSEVARFPEPAQRLGTLLARYPIGYLAAYFERQIARGRIQPVDPWLASQAFLGSLVGYAVRKYVAQHADLQPVADDDMAATVTRLFAHGLLAGQHEDRLEGGPDGTDR